MTASTATATATATADLTDLESSSAVRANRHLVRNGVVAGLAAAVATVGVAAIASAAGVPVEISGESIPLMAFAQLTLFATAIGVVLATLFGRRAANPRRVFVSTTVVLTTLSFVPDVLADAHASTKLTLMLTHVVAAAIVIPTLASRLTD